MTNWVDGYFANSGWLKIPKVTTDGSGNPTGLTYLGTTIPLGGIALTDVWNAGGVRFDGVNFIDENSAIISGSPSVADYAALLALSASDYARFAVNIASGANNGFFASNGSAFAPLNGQYVQERSGVPQNTYVFPDNVTWTAADNGSGKVRIHSSAAHNITEANAEGSYLYLISGGTGWTALTSHRITPNTGYVGTQDLDLDTNYTASMGVPVFAKRGTLEANSEIPLLSITLPALRANTEVILEATIEWSVDASTSSKRSKFYLESVEFTNQNNTTANSTSSPFRFGFRNQGDASVQRSLQSLGSTGYASGTGAISTGTSATATAGKIMTVRAMCDIAGITARVSAYTVIIRG